MRIDVNTIGTHLECRLGKWYYSTGKEILGQNEVFKSMEKPHIELHEMAKEAAIAYSKGDITGAERALEKMNDCSLKVVLALEKLKVQIK